MLVPIGQSVTAWANDELIGVADYRTLGSTREAEVTESFHADVQADNSEMLPVLANLGLTGQPQEPSGASPGPTVLFIR